MKIYLKNNNVILTKSKQRIILFINLDFGSKIKQNEFKK